MMLAVIHKTGVFGIHAQACTPGTGSPLENLVFTVLRTTCVFVKRQGLLVYVALWDAFLSLDILKLDIGSCILRKQSVAGMNIGKNYKKSLFSHTPSAMQRKVRPNSKC